jgi:hypothetical protein
MYKNYMMYDENGQTVTIKSERVNKTQVADYADVSATLSVEEICTAAVEKAVSKDESFSFTTFKAEVVNAKRIAEIEKYYASLEV